MAYTTKLIMKLPSELASELKTYLDGETIATLHSISTVKVGQFIACLIVFE